MKYISSHEMLMLDELELDSPTTNEMLACFSYN